ncbi:MAG TPA: protein phosphatase 2C domain-containing protein [Burkholderiaceae bacterium]|nr:protein phosphatase 2C domain-containing protein [Burkholderiaceae bacterium]
MSKDLHFSAATGIHQGDRASQQDRVHIFKSKREPKCLLVIVADGMGGASGGRKASDQVMQTAEQLFKSFNSKTDDAKKLLEQIALEAHTVIGLTAITSEQQPHSTYAAFLTTSSGECHWAHVGDSRIYHFNHATLVKRTSDHSYVQALVDCGELTEEKAQRHPKANILTRILGSKSAPAIDFHHVAKIKSGDCFIACTDGLWAYYSVQELGQILANLPPREATEFLIQSARTRCNKRGDNLSVAIVKYD